MRMHRVTTSVVPPVGAERPIFRGEVRPATVFEQPETETMKVLEVTFRDGGRTVWHTHSSDQVLYATQGLGYVEDETERLELRTGDLVLIPRGTRHRHGAQEGSDLTHLAFATAGETTIEED